MDPGNRDSALTREIQGSTICTVLWLKERL